MRTASSRSVSISAVLLIAGVLGHASAIAAQAERPAARASEQATEQDWIQLFNGRDLSGWTPKISQHRVS